MTIPQDRWVVDKITEFHCCLCAKQITHDVGRCGAQFQPTGFQKWTVDMASFTINQLEEGTCRCVCEVWNVVLSCHCGSVPWKIAKAKKVRPATPSSKRQQAVPFNQTCKRQPHRISFFHTHWFDTNALLLANQKKFFGETASMHREGTLNERLCYVTKSSIRHCWLLPPVRDFFGTWRSSPNRSPLAVG